MKTLLFLFAPSRAQWFCRLDGCDGYGRGATKEDALMDFVWQYCSSLGVDKVEMRDIQHRDFIAMSNGGIHE